MVSQVRSPIDAFREVMATVTSGVAVLTLVDDAGTPLGMTISSLTPVSPEPPTVLMVIGGKASCLPALVPGRVFAANVLGSSHFALSAAFAFGEADPFRLTPWTRTGDGPPVLDEAPAYLIGRVDRLVPHAGSVVVLCDVLGGEVRRPDSLAYWRKAYHRLTPVGEAGKW
jgi:flavin reductase (DIM6/NTAB) family NADH-FMN oxidoreductase RutF